MVEPKEEKIKMLKKAIESNPKYIASYITLGILYCMEPNKIGTIKGI